MFCRFGFVVANFPVRFSAGEPQAELSVFQEKPTIPPQANLSDFQGLGFRVEGLGFTVENRLRPEIS